MRENEGIAAKVLQSMGADLSKVRQVVLEMLGSSIGGQSPSGGEKPRGKGKSGNMTTPTLDSYSRNLNALVEEGKLDPVIGREVEIERVIQILSRRTKNNPVLIGEPGVGKTAVAEGLAQRIVMGAVPEILIGKRVMSLNIATVLAGAKYRGEFEERCARLLMK